MIVDPFVVGAEHLHYAGRESRCGDLGEGYLGERLEQIVNVKIFGGVDVLADRSERENDRFQMLPGFIVGQLVWSADH